MWYESHDVALSDDEAFEVVVHTSNFLICDVELMARRCRRRSHRPLLRGLQGISYQVPRGYA